MTCNNVPWQASPCGHAVTVTYRVSLLFSSFHTNRRRGTVHQKCNGLTIVKYRYVYTSELISLDKLFPGAKAQAPPFQCFMVS